MVMVNAGTHAKHYQCQKAGVPCGIKVFHCVDPGKPSFQRNFGSLLFKRVANHHLFEYHGFVLWGSCRPDLLIQTYRFVEGRENWRLMCCPCSVRLSCSCHFLPPCSSFPRSVWQIEEHTAEEDTPPDVVFRESTTYIVPFSMKWIPHKEESEAQLVRHIPAHTKTWRSFVKVENKCMWKARLMQRVE